MRKIENGTAEKIPDAAWWENWLLTLSAGLRETLQMTAAAMTEIGGTLQPVSFRPVPVSGVLTERIVSGGGAVLPGDGSISVLQDSDPVQATVSSQRQVRQYRRNSRTSYETARELQKQSELLLRT